MVLKFRRWKDSLVPCLLIVLLLTTGTAWAQVTSNQVFGKKMLAHYNLLPQDIERFRQYLDTSESNSETPDDQRIAEARWMGPGIQVERESGPYTVVLRVRGQTKHRGDVQTQWGLGWKIDGGTNTTLFDGPSQKAIKGVTKIELVKQSGSMRFSDQRTIYLVLEPRKWENIDIQDVDIEIWRGSPDFSWSSWLFELRWVFLAMVIVVLVYKVRRRIQVQYDN